MAVTTTRNQHQLIIQSWTRRPDGRIVFVFILARAGIWFEVPQSCIAYPPWDNNGFPMTPAWGDPQHTPSPIFVATPGQAYTWVWDAPVDGFPSGNMSGWTFKLGYLDLYCCDEIEDDENYPPGDDDPPVPVPPPVPPVEDEPPSNGIPDPGDTVPPGVNRNPDPDAGNEDPSGQVPLFPGGTVEPGTFRLSDGTIFRFDGEQFWLQDPDRGWYPVLLGTLIEIVGFLESDFTEFLLNPEDYIERLPDEGIVVDGARGDFIEPSTQEPFGVGPSSKTSFLFGLDDPATVPVYPEDVDGHLLFGLPNELEGIEIKAYAPIEMNMNEFGLDRYTVTGLIRNINEQAWGGGQIYVKAVALGADGTVLRITDPQPIEVCYPTEDWVYPDGTIQPAPPPPTVGTIPPGISGIPPICFTANGQLPPHVIQVLIVIMNSMFQPIMAAPAQVTPVIMGPGLPVGTQFGTNQQQNTYPDLLGQEIRSFCNFKTGIEPEYEGSYAGVGDEDCHVVTILRDLPAFVITTTADAINSGFDPELLFYDVNDMTTPVLTVRSKLKKNGQPISPTKHILGYRDDSGVLVKGFKYAVVVKHKYPFYSKRWVYGIWHEEQSVITGGVFNRTVGGLLTGQLSCAYGRQSIKLLNERTGNFIYLKTDEIGVCTDFFSKSKGGSPSKTLAVQYGDVIEIIRPGPGLLYRRHGDLIGEGIVL